MFAADPGPIPHVYLMENTEGQALDEELESDTDSLPSLVEDLNVSDASLD